MTLSLLRWNILFARHRSLAQRPLSIQFPLRCFGLARTRQVTSGQVARERASRGLLLLSELLLNIELAGFLVLCLIAIRQAIFR